MYFKTNTLSKIQSFVYVIKCHLCLFKTNTLSQLEKVNTLSVNYIMYFFQIWWLSKINEGII